MGDHRPQCMTAWHIISVNIHATDDCKRRLRPRVAKKKAIIGGVTDDTNNGADRLLYRRYANALVNVAKQAEVRKLPLIIGISVPWGVGKTKLWNLIKDILLSGDNASRRDEKDNETEHNPSLLNKFASTLKLAFYIIYLLTEALIRTVSCNSPYELLNSDDEEIQAVDNIDSNDTPVAGGSDESNCAENNSTTRVIGGMFTITLSLLPFLKELYTFVATILPQLGLSSRVERLKKQALSGAGADRRNFTADTGFMGDVRKKSRIFV